MNAALSVAALEKLTTEINTFHDSEGMPHKSLDEVAYGFVKVRLMVVFKMNVCRRWATEHSDIM